MRNCLASGDKPTRKLQVRQCSPDDWKSQQARRFQESEVTHPGLIGTHLHILAFISRDCARRRQWSRSLQIDNSIWLLHLCNGFGGEGMMDRTSGFWLFIYFTRVGLASSALTP